jgi:Protein of unknown function (DUF2490)
MRVVLFSLLFCLFSNLVFAQTSSSDPVDVQGWYGLGVKFNLPKKWTLDVDYQTRWINNLSLYNGSYISVTGRKKIGKIVELAGEYRLALVKKGVYHRFSIGAEASKKFDKLEFGFRLLVQNQLQDFVDPGKTNDTDAYWRARLGLKYDINKVLEVYASTEPVMKFSGNYFVDNWRNTAGFKIKILPHTKLDLFYIYRPDFAKSSYNRYFNIVGFNIDYSVPKRKKK